MTQDSHAARNNAQLRQLERARSHDVVRAHNALVAAVDELDEDALFNVLDDAEAEALGAAEGLLVSLMDVLAANEHLLDKHDRLLASPERDNR